ncbi:hypothetical protein [Arthrobacter sp. VKM Ac-2550]|uniref:hypothetical protein n=1 Tax=Crystallibacter permensis TaxID=1938888 RepID=UPI0022260EC8|nr:hypothetical protein [Arthrobacter sp. VKM Ac-2550]
MGKTANRFGYAALALLALGAAATGHMIVQEMGEALAGLWTAADDEATAARPSD